MRKYLKVRPVDEIVRHDLGVSLGADGAHHADVGRVEGAQEIDRLPRGLGEGAMGGVGSSAHVTRTRSIEIDRMPRRGGVRLVAVQR